MSTDLKMDFFNDYAEWCRAALLTAGYAVDPTETAESLVTKYFNVRHRRVPPRARQVHKAKSFHCPTEHLAGLQAFLAKATNGDDLRPYQSTRLAKAEFDDAMLNDWGVQHFHLGTGSHPKLPSFVSRTGPVLYAVVKDDDLYCINVMEHGKWSSQDILESINTNWRHLLSPSHPKSSNLKPQGLAVHYSDEDIAKLRKAGIQPITQRKDGSITIAPGGGIAMDGTSGRVVSARTRLVSRCRELQRVVSQEIEALIRDGKATPPFEFHLQLVDGTTHAVDQKAACNFNLGFQLAADPL
jgi:hypothetical protein